MKWILFFWLNIFLLSYVYAENINGPSSLSSKEAQVLIEDYLLHERKMNLEKYALKGISFEQSTKRWFAFYSYKKCPCPIGGHFGVYVSDKKPFKFDFVFGL